MVDAAPFRALRYDPKVAGDPATTSAPAYDDVERFAYARHRTASPYTVLELLAPATGGPAAGTYRGAAATFERWRRTGVLVEDETPAFYRYEQHELRAGVPAVQRGLLAAVAVGDPHVLTHERVDPERVADRVARMAAVPADLTPVFAVCPDAPPALAAALDRRPPGPPLVAFTDESGTDHRVWALRDPGDVADIRAALAGVHVVIADGHHRWAAAAVRPRGLPGWGRTLMHLVNARHHGPQLLGVHRLVRNLPGDVERRLDADFHVVRAPADPAALAAVVERGTEGRPPPGGAAGPDGDGAALPHASPGPRMLGLWLPGGRARLLTARDDAALSRRLPADRPAVWRDLDTAVLHSAVLPALGATEVDYRTDVAAAAAEVEAAGSGGLFVLRPPALASVYACAAAGAPMPAKTTWFRPKPRAGLVLRSLDSG